MSNKRRRNTPEILQVLPAPADTFAVTRGTTSTRTMQRVFVLVVVRMGDSPPLLLSQGPHGELLFADDNGEPFILVDGDDNAPDGGSWWDLYANGVVRDAGIVEIDLPPGNPVRVRPN